MTISTSLFFSKAVSLMSQNQTDLATMQEKVATGKEIVRASDGVDKALNIARLKANIEKLDARTRSTVQQASVMALGPAKRAHDLILLDPPYDTSAGAVALDRLLRLGWIERSTWIALETGAKDAVHVKSLHCVAERRVGKARLWLLRLDPDAA